MSAMTPDSILRKILVESCLDHLPLLELHEDERAFWSTWEEKRSKAMLANLHRKEKRFGKPLGPRGNWAWRKHEYGRWYRSHRLDEVIVEWMCPAWMCPGLDPDYITVISSGPFGGLYQIYRNERFLTMEMDPPFGDRTGMIEWLQRYDSKASMENRMK